MIDQAAMTPEAMQQCLDRLPESQQHTAQLRIVLATLAGWKVLGVWEWGVGSARHKLDLVGYDAKGHFNFLERTEWPKPKA